MVNGVKKRLVWGYRFYIANGKTKDDIYSYGVLSDEDDRGVFFFQAGDGIRDLVLSRGLGDVYKMQQMMGVYLFLIQKLQTLL